MVLNLRVKMYLSAETVNISLLLFITQAPHLTSGKLRVKVHNCAQFRAIARNGIAIRNPTSV